MKGTVTECDYTSNMELYDNARSRSELNLQSTRASHDADAHRDMDGFDGDEELARLHRALKEAETVSPEQNPKLYRFIAEATLNLDEEGRRGGPMPAAWSHRSERQQKGLDHG